MLPPPPLLLLLLLPPPTTSLSSKLKSWRTANGGRDCIRPSFMRKRQNHQSSPAMATTNINYTTNNINNSINSKPSAGMHNGTFLCPLPSPFLFYCTSFSSHMYRISFPFLIESTSFHFIRLKTTDGKTPESLPKSNA